VLEEKPLDPSVHDRQSFDCGIAALNEYLQRFAEQHRKKGISAAYVLVDSAMPAEILGYYTLSAAEVGVERLADADRKRLPRYPIPCIRMGRLACRSDQQGRGFGKLLLGCAVDRCLKVREQLAAYALIADAKDDTARRFYERFGFRALRDAALTLYLPLGR
jgi:GNAT superfamily N-acetyltransferase